MDESTLAISYGFKLMVQAIFVDSTIHKENISNAVSYFKWPVNGAQCFKNVIDLWVIQ